MIEFLKAMIPPQAWWQPWIPLFPLVAALITVISALTAAVVTQIMESRRRRRKIRAHWAALRAEVDFCRSRAQEYRDAKPFVQAPLYRLPTVAYSKSFPALLGDGAVTEAEARHLIEFFTEVQTLNRGLDQAQEARGNDQTLKAERNRNVGKVDAIEGHYRDLRPLIDTHLGG